jgi:dienelactone hydrolase
MNRSLAVAAFAALFSFATAHACAGPLPASAFAYTPQPFATDAIFHDAGDGTTRGVLTYTMDGRKQTAEIVAPANATASGPGVLFVHWLGDDATTNHTEFEADAIALAKRGATCVLLDAMWSTVTNNGPNWFEKLRSTKTDYANSIAQVIDLRRGLDLLLAQPHVDPARVAYVGHDFGSMYGAVLAGVDPRPSWFVLMAGTTSFSKWYLLGTKPADIPAYVKQMEPLDPLPYLTRSRAKGFLFQFASHDEFIGAASASAFAAAAPLPRGVFLYDTDHALNIPGARADRLAWLETRLFP